VKRLSFLSFSFVDGSLHDVVKWVLEKPNYFRRIVTLNPLMFMQAQGLESWLSSADLVVPDGEGMCMALSKQEKKKVQSIPGIDLVEAVIKTGGTCYLVGARPEIVKQAAYRVGSQVLGWVDGFQAEAEWGAVIEDMQAKKADFIFVGMGFPKQETFIKFCSTRVDYGTAIGVGGSIDVLAGDIKRAPIWVRTVRLEWLYRAVKEPRRFKSFVDLIRFYRRYC
jgi:N-acetylglucosaminyldiphosphoundecaprenol N-acetyl-beta-D-mannosaminyltransferase